MPDSFDPTSKQLQATELISGPSEHDMLFGGSRSGKTFWFIRAIVVRAINASGSRHAVLRFRFNHVKASVVLDTFPAVMSLCFPTVKYRQDKSDWYAEFENGSQVWFGGLDDKQRTEKVLGQEYATIFLNECSQISYDARNIAMTRLAQVVTIDEGRPGAGQALRLKMFYDENPPTQGHWTHRLFIERRDPTTRKPLENPEKYAHLQINPGDNSDNLPPSYLATLASLPARMRRRFLDGEFGAENPDALWAEETFDKWREFGAIPDLSRVVIAVDPSGSGDEDNAGNDEIGIVAGGLGVDGNAYVLEDLTLKAGPATWGKVATGAYDRLDADLIVGEVNYGGAMVGHVIRTARENTPYRTVTASRGKVVRAEPIAALYEQGRVRHVGQFRKLEDELLGFSTTGYTGGGSPNRADALVWLLSEMFMGITRPEKKKKSRPREQISIREGGWMAA